MTLEEAGRLRARVDRVGWTRPGEDVPHRAPLDSARLPPAAVIVGGEFARNVLRIEDAEHDGSSPAAPRLVVTPLACSLVGLEQRVRIVPGTRTAALYGDAEPGEDYRCNYGVD